MRLLRSPLTGLILLAMILLLWFWWQGQRDENLQAEAAVTPTLVPTSTPPPTFTAVATTTAMPTLTPTQTATPSPTPSSTPTPLSTSTAAATATMPPPATAVSLPTDRTCPDPPPLKPVYNRYYLPGVSSWPTPDPALATPHFWLSYPFAGSDRLLINQWYPYGSDGNGRYLLHNGIDMAEPLGTPLLAVASGTVVVAQSDMNELYGWRCNWYGQLVVLELDDTWQGQAVYVLYGHVLNIVVEAGQRVERGEMVAEVGFGGVSLAPHLHLEVRMGSNQFGATRNPVLWFPPGKARGVIAGRLVDPQARPWQGVSITLIEASEEGPVFTNTWSYLDDPQHLINPDEGWAENFVFADVPPGEHELYVKLQGIEYRVPVQVTADEISAVEIVTEAFKTPTPEAEE